MIVLASYLLKVIICSGILFLYYHLALRNKLFHQWNRFYLIAAIVLSIVAPIIQIQLEQPDHTSGGGQILYAFSSANQYIDTVTTSSRQSLSAEDWISILYAAVSAVILITVLLSLVKIFAIIRSHSVKFIERIRFINTRIPGTPFSFFDYIFWNDAISIQSEEGAQIFQHELVHVKEKHSLDKLFVQLVLVAFWCNPFFWLIRREMRMIHEFIADKKAVGIHGAEALARMILQAGYTQNYHSLTNQFFQTSIKRRLIMLTKLNNPRLSYTRRILALPVMALVIMAFGSKMKETLAQPGKRSGLSASVIVPDVDTVPALMYKGKKITDVRIARKKTYLIFQDGSRDSLPLEEARNLNLLPSLHPVTVMGYSKTVPDPLMVVNGKEFNGKMDDLNPSNIESINVLKGSSASSKYGARGKNGVVEVTMKKTGIEVRDVILENIIDTAAVREVKVEGYEIDNQVFQKTEVPASIELSVWRKFLEENLQPFIEDMANKGAEPGQYTVTLRFIVETNGSITDIRSLNDPGYGIAVAAEKLALSSPRWRPAMQNGKPVRSYHNQPITFVIAEQTDEVITISSPHPRIFFLGIENPLKISSSKYKPEDILVQISNGSIEKRGTGYVVNVNHPGKTSIWVKVNDNGWKNLATATFEVRPLPPYDPAKTEKIFIDGVEYSVPGRSTKKRMIPRRTDGSETAPEPPKKGISRKTPTGSVEEVTVTGYPIRTKS